MITPSAQIALIGFGAQGQLLAAALAPRGYALRAFDESMDAHMERHGVDAAPSLAAALHGAKLVIVTADGTLGDVARRDLEALLVPGQIRRDLVGPGLSQVAPMLAALGLPPAGAPALTRSPPLRGELP